MVRECPSWCSIVGATLTVHQFFCPLHFCHTCSLCRVKLVVQFSARRSTQVLLCLFPGVLWLWHFLYSVGPHPVSSLYIYTFVVSRAFMAGAASQAGDADSCRAPGLTSGLQGSVNVHRGALLLVTRWQCISSCVFYIYRCLIFVVNGIPTDQPKSVHNRCIIDHSVSVLCSHFTLIVFRWCRRFCNRTESYLFLFSYVHNLLQELQVRLVPCGKNIAHSLFQHFETSDSESEAWKDE